MGVIRGEQSQTTARSEATEKDVGRNCARRLDGRKVEVATMSQDFMSLLFEITKPPREKNAEYKNAHFPKFAILDSALVLSSWCIYIL